MSDPIERVTIVGGGTAGWLTALILNGAINKDTKQPRVKFTLIESPKVPTIGVGESTIQSIKNTFQFLGIDEAEFIRKCNGSFKLGVHFVDWSRSPSADFFHPLNDPPKCGHMSPAYHFHKFGPHLPGRSFGENILPNASVIAAGKGPRHLNAGQYQSEVNYAYHLDAALFAKFMGEFSVARGVEHIRDDVQDVEFDGTGSLAALHLEQRGRYPVEFVIDCTGFKALIWSRMGAEGFKVLQDRLFNDRAIPIQIPHRQPAKIEPCTRATALSAGWVWRVPLYSRVGTGYVYSSAFKSDDEARAELLTHLRKVGDLPEKAADPDTRVIQMRTGYTSQPWVRNCVAMGLANGFVEPLEATAIYLVDVMARLLLMNFPKKNFSPALAKAYNERTTRLFEEIFDFLQMNYVTSDRMDPYWISFREEAKLSDWLRDKLELWKDRFPEDEDTRDRMLFNHLNYTYVMYSKGYFSNMRPVLENSVKAEDWKSFGRDLKTRLAELLTTLPSHYELVSHIRNETQMRSSGAQLLRWPQ
jgi:tryptophan halogenase